MAGSSETEKSVNTYLCPQLDKGAADYSESPVSESQWKSALRGLCYLSSSLWMRADPQWLIFPRYLFSSESLGIGDGSILTPSLQGEDIIHTIKLGPEPPKPYSLSRAAFRVCHNPYALVIVLFNMRATVYPISSLWECLANPRCLAFALRHIVVKRFNVTPLCKHSWIPPSKDF